MTGFTRIAILFAPVLRIKSRTRASVTDVKRTRMASREKRTRPTDRGIRALGKTELTDRAQFRAASSLVRRWERTSHTNRQTLVLLLHCLGVAPERGGATDGDVDGAPSSTACVPRARPRLSALSLRTLARSRAPARDIVARGTRKPVRVVDTFSFLLGSPRCDYTCLHTDTHTPARNTRHVYTDTRHALL